MVMTEIQMNKTFLAESELGFLVWVRPGLMNIERR